MPPFHDTRFWNDALIGQMSLCWQIRDAVDSIVLFQCQALLFGKQYKFLCETFCSSLSSKKSKKYICDQLEEENLSLQNVELF